MNKQKNRNGGVGRGGKLTLEAKHYVLLSSPSHPHFFSCTFNSSPSNV